jgi:hypothetical protein
MYTGRRFAGLGDLLTEPSLPLTPENLSLGYNRDPYNQAVAALNALVQQREDVVQKYSNPPYGPIGTAAIWALPEYITLTQQIADAQAVVTTYDQRIAAIEAAQQALAPQIQAVEQNPEYQFWASKGATGPADYVAKFGMPANPLDFFGIHSVVTGTEQGKVIIVWTVPIGTPKADWPKYLWPDQPIFTGDFPQGSWPAVGAFPITGDPLTDWNNGLAMRFHVWADPTRLARPSPWRWLRGDFTSADYADWSKQYGAVFPTPEEYAAAVEAVKASGGPVTQQTISQQFATTVATLTPEQIAQRTAAIPVPTPLPATTSSLPPPPPPGASVTPQPTGAAAPVPGTVPGTYTVPGGGYVSPGGSAAGTPEGQREAAAAAPAQAGISNALLIGGGLLVAVLLLSGRQRRAQGFPRY